MTNEEVLEGNKLIANFLGESVQEIKLSKEVTLLAHGEEDEMPDYINIVYFEPNCDWNELMRCVRKIVKYCTEESEEAFMSDEYTSILDTVCLADIESSYRVVIEFIKWYNNQPKT